MAAPSIARPMTLFGSRIGGHPHAPESALVSLSEGRSNCGRGESVAIDPTMAAWREGMRAGRRPVLWDRLHRSRKTVNILVTKDIWRR